MFRTVTLFLCKPQNAPDKSEQELLQRAGGVRHLDITKQTSSSSAAFIIAIQQLHKWIAISLNPCKHNKKRSGNMALQNS